jgi:hypothetical protein
MFIALHSLEIPLRQERHVTEHVRAHCAPLERALNWKHGGYKHHAPPEQLAAQTIMLLRSNLLRKQI